VSDAAERLAAIRERVAAACARAGRRREAVRLVAASKKQPVAAMRILHQLGVGDFGESQVQEALPKIEQLADTAIEWHFIGHLQSNKTREIPGHFHWVHAIDSVRLAARLSAACGTDCQPLALLLQVNVAQDPAKHGLLPRDLYAVVEELMQRQLPGVQLRGLMTIGRLHADDYQTRAGFAALRDLLEGCRQRFGEHFSELSMGMSGDFETAIEEGATMVRVGTALFGSRESP
jgi:pyridoxal phosphate enzyme (YggS family)